LHVSYLYAFLTGFYLKAAGLSGLAGLPLLPGVAFTQCVNPAAEPDDATEARSKNVAFFILPKRLRGVLTQRSAFIWKCLFVVAIILAASAVYVADRQGLAFSLPPKTALSIGLGLFTLMGAVIGAAASWLLCRKHSGQIGGGYAE
jgi:peptidoglycan/LPS O-acetylase OafA/YrhL